MTRPSRLPIQTFGLLAILAACAILGLLAGCFGNERDTSLDRVRAAGFLHFGTDPSYPPFEMYDASGDVAGFDIDLANALAKEIGVTASFGAYDVDSMPDALLAGRIDAAICGLPPMPELSRTIVGTRPYFDAGPVLVIQQGQTSNAITTDNWKDRVVAVEKGSTGEAEAKLQLGSAGNRLLVTSTAAEAITMLTSGRAEAALVDRISALQAMRDGVNLEILEPSLRQEPYVVLTRGKDALLAQALDSALQRLIDSGHLRLLRDKWI